MNDPPRLFEDATSSLGRALAAERAGVDAHDAAALKSRVLTHVATGAAPTAWTVGAMASTWTAAPLPLLLAGALGLGVGVAGTWATLRVVDARSATAADAPTTAPALDDAPTAAVPTTAAPTASALDDAPDAGAPVVADDDDATDGADDDVTARAEAPPPPTTKSARVTAQLHAANDEAAKARGSALEDEMRRYDRAQAALRDGRPLAAIDELRASLAAHPRGALRDDARLTLLEALLAAGRLSEARRLGVELAADDALADRRREIWGVVSTAALQMNDCDEAGRAMTKAGDARPRVTSAVARCREKRDAVGERRGDGSGDRRE